MDLNNEATRRFLLNSHCRGEVEQLVSQDEEITADAEFGDMDGQGRDEDTNLTQRLFLQSYE
ncbi:hypothetical protein D3C75_1214550 [compost metagenome]